MAYPFSSTFVFHFFFSWWPTTAEPLTQEFWLLVGQNLVEDVVISLSLELEGHTGLLQKICDRYKRERLSCV